MKRIKWACETGFAGCIHEGEIEMPDDSTEEEINEAVMDDVLNIVSWTWWEE